MKKLLSVLAAVTAAVALALTVSAEDVKLGDVYSSDILATVDGHPIPSYNIGGRTCLCIEDLRYYGFDVVWDAENKIISATSSETRPDYSVFASVERGVGGSVIGAIYATDIRAEVNGYALESYNLGGYTVVCMEDLGDLADSPNVDFGYSRYLMRASWDAENKIIALDTLRLTPDTENPILQAGLDYGCDYRAGEPYGVVRVDDRVTRDFRGAIRDIVPLYLENSLGMTDIVIAYACPFGVSFDAEAVALILNEELYEEYDPEIAANEAANEIGFEMVELLYGDGSAVLYGYYEYADEDITYSLRLFMPDGRVIELLEDLPTIDAAEREFPLESISISEGETELYFSLVYERRLLSFEVELRTGDLGMR